MIVAGKERMMMLQVKLVYIHVTKGTTMLILMIFSFFSSSVRIYLGKFCLLGHFHVFVHQSVAPGYIAACVCWMLFVLFVIPAGGSAQLQVCISVTDQG